MSNRINHNNQSQSSKSYSMIQNQQPNNVRNIFLGDNRISPNPDQINMYSSYKNDSPQHQTETNQNYSYKNLNEPQTVKTMDRFILQGKTTQDLGYLNYKTHQNHLMLQKYNELSKTRKNQSYQSYPDDKTVTDDDRSSRNYQQEFRPNQYNHNEPISSFQQNPQKNLQEIALPSKQYQNESINTYYTSQRDQQEFILPSQQYQNEPVNTQLTSQREKQDPSHPPSQQQSESLNSYQTKQASPIQDEQINQSNQPLTNAYQQQTEYRQLLKHQQSQPNQKLPIPIYPGQTNNTLNPLQTVASMDYRQRYRLNNNIYNPQFGVRSEIFPENYVNKKQLPYNPITQTQFFYPTKQDQFNLSQNAHNLDQSSHYFYESQNMNLNTNPNHTNSQSLPDQPRYKDAPLQTYYGKQQYFDSAHNQKPNQPKLEYLDALDMHQSFRAKQAENEHKEKGYPLR